jgi:hypothetical protein
MFRKYQLAIWLSIQNFYSHFTKLIRKCEYFGCIVEPCMTLTLLLTTVNKTGATSRAGPAYPSEHLSHVARSLVVCVMFCRTLFILFLLAIVLISVRK